MGEMDLFMRHLIKGEYFASLLCVCVFGSGFSPSIPLQLYGLQMGKLNAPDLLKSFARNGEDQFEAKKARVHKMKNACSWIRVLRFGVGDGLFV